MVHARIESYGTPPKQDEIRNHIGGSLFFKMIIVPFSTTRRETFEKFKLAVVMETIIST
jgi:hypothetical protein